MLAPGPFQRPAQVQLISGAKPLQQTIHSHLAWQSIFSGLRSFYGKCGGGRRGVGAGGGVLTNLFSVTTLFSSYGSFRRVGRSPGRISRDGMGPR